LLGHIGLAEGAVRAGLAQFDEGEPQFLANLGRRTEGGGRIAVIGALRIAIGRQADADAVRAPHVDQGFQNLAHEAGAVLRRAAVCVGAKVGLVAQKLVDQVAIGAVELDPIKARLLRVFGRAAVIADGALDVLQRHFAGLRIGLLAGRRVRFARRGGGAGGEGRFAPKEIGVDDAAHVPQLHDDQAAFFVHGLGGGLPRLGLLVRPDAGGGGPAEAFAADAGRFGQDHARACTLAVIERHQLVRHEHRIARAPAGERGHVDAVLGVERAHLERLKQGIMHKCAKSS